jgi:hypothetical protein
MNSERDHNTKYCTTPLVAQEAKLWTSIAEVVTRTAANAFAKRCPDLRAQRLYSTDALSFKKNKMHRAFVALGSNMGDRFAMIELACKEMEKADISVVRTSGLWETKPMYVENQDNFLNGVCEVRPPITSTCPIIYNNVARIGPHTG